MGKILYIIPGWKETCRRKPYQSLAKIAKNKGYEVVFHNVDWTRPLSPQVFSVPENAVIFGFSLGSILAWLVAQDNPCRYLILASMTPLGSFKRVKTKKALTDLLGYEFVRDATKKLKPKNLAKKQIRMYGSLELEEESVDIVVPDTGHELNKQYLKKITRIL